MKRFPGELEALLSPKGRRVLAGKDRSLHGALARDGIVFAQGLLDAKLAPRVAALLHHAFDDVMGLLEKRVVRADTASEINGTERLGKAMRSRGTGDDPKGPAADRGMECGLIPLLRSESYQRFAERLTGRALIGPAGMQVLCNREGDYAGPHTDHLPENPWGKHGYFDFHFTFCTPGVKRQLIVYEQDGQLNGVHELQGVGGLTAYQLPRWHYTTPLEVTKQSARRWIVMNSFYDATRVPRTASKQQSAPAGVVAG